MSDSWMVPVFTVIVAILGGLSMGGMRSGSGMRSDRVEPANPEQQYGSGSRKKTKRRNNTSKRR